MTAFGINILDIVFILIVAVLAVRGLMRGLIEEVGALFGLFAGFVLANRYLEQVSAFLGDYVSSPAAAVVIAYLLIFIAAMLAVLVIVRIIKKILIVSVAKWLDYMAGAALGVAKGLLLCLLIYIGFQFIAPDSDLLQGSVVAPHLSELLSRVEEFLPNLTPGQGGSAWFSGLEL